MPSARTLLQHTFSLSLLCVLAACNLLPAQNSAPPAIKAAQVTRPFPPDTLYALLLAEMALDRGQMNLALVSYLQQAHKTRDLGVVSRATLLADYLHAPEAALNAATLWTTLAPNNPEPRFILARYQLLTQRTDLAFDSSKKLLSMKAQTLFLPIAAAATNAQQRQSLLKSYQDLLQQYPHSIDLLLGTALLLEQQQNYAESLRYIAKAQTEDKQNPQARLLEVDVLYKSGNPEKAIKRMSSLVEASPSNANLRLQYARLLTAYNLQKAREQFDYLAKDNPLNADLLLARALINYRLNDFVQATDLFEQLLFLGKSKDVAHYYLGDIAQTTKQPQKALEHYRRVEPNSGEYLPAVARAVDLMMKEGQSTEIQRWLAEQRRLYPEQAVQLYLIEAETQLIKQRNPQRSLAVLNDGIHAHPEATKLYYARSLLLEQTGKTQAAEADLRRVLAAQPNNVDALNALGYLLLNNDKKMLGEAEQLIRRALAQRPEDPAIMDSMGWLLFRLGQYEEAVLRLQRAYQLLPNDEVAAHLGEALWRGGHQKAAEKIWAQGLKQKPDSDIIRATQKRLQAS